MHDDFAWLAIIAFLDRRGIEFGRWGAKQGTYAMTSESKSAVTLGHLRLSVTNLKGAVNFFEAMGAHQDVDRDGFAVVEFSDRTRLQLTETKEAVAGDGALQFDFRVDDIDAAWKTFSDKGLKPSEITRRNPGHDWFLLDGPDGVEVKINSAFKRN